MCVCLSVVWTPPSVSALTGNTVNTSAFIQYVGVFVLTAVLYTVKFNCHSLCKCVPNNHEKRLPTIALMCVGAGNTVGWGKVSVDYWTTSIGDNKRPSGGGERRGQINEIWMCLLNSCHGGLLMAGGILKIHSAADGFTYTAAIPAIFRHCSNQHTTHRNHNHPQKLSSSHSSSPFPSSPSTPVRLHYRFQRARRCRKLKLARSINTI